MPKKYPYLVEFKVYEDEHDRPESIKKRVRASCMMDAETIILAEYMGSTDDIVLLDCKRLRK